MNFKQRKEALYQRVILDKTAQLCQQKGPYNLTMREVAKLSGTTVSSIYANFGSKDELINRLTTKVVRCKAEWLQIQMSQHEDALKKLITYYRANFAFLKRHPIELSVINYTMSIKSTKQAISQVSRYQEEEERQPLFDLALEIYGNLESEGYVSEEIDISVAHELITHSLRQIMYLILILQGRPEYYYWDYLRMILRSLIKAEHHPLVEKYLLEKATYPVPKIMECFSEPE